jgi:hypothetical protein
LKKSGKKRDAEVAELQAQNLNLSTELRAMRREVAAAAAGGESSATGESLSSNLVATATAPAASAATTATVVAVKAPAAGSVHCSAEFAALDESEFAGLQKELAQLKQRNRQLEAIHASQFGAGGGGGGGGGGSPVQQSAAVAPPLPKRRPKLTAEEEEKLAFVQDLGGVAKVRQLLQQSGDAEIKETARELLATLPKDAEEILAERENGGAVATTAGAGAGAGAGGGAGSIPAAGSDGGQWKAIAEERTSAAEAAQNRVADLELQLKRSQKQVKALQSLAQADGNAPSSEAAAQMVASLAQGDSQELDAARAARQAAEKRCEALEVQLTAQRDTVRSLEADVRQGQAALGAASAKGKGGKEQAAAAAAAAAAAQAAVTAVEQKLDQERESWKQAEATLRETNAAEVKRINGELESQSAELSALKASAAAVAEARGDAVQSLKSAQKDLEMETAARKAAQARADDADGKLTTAEAKLQAALSAAKTQSQYLIKLARELKRIRATFDEISVTVNLHGAVNFGALQKLVTTSTMPAAEVAKAMASIETDAARRLPELMVERKRLQNEIQELRGNIRVIARVRPLSSKEQAAGDEECVSYPASGELTITNEKKRSIDFEYDFVARQDCRQVEVFKEVRAVAQSVLDGYNCCIFAYGQTGSGKTHTMTGSASDPGVNVRLVEELFSISSKAWTGHVYTFRVSMVEIYNEALRDLLAVPNSSGKKDIAKADKKASLDLRLNQDGSLQVAGLEEAVCGSAADAQKVMEAGLKNRGTTRTHF